MAADEAFRRSIVEGLVNGTLGQDATASKPKPKPVEKIMESESQSDGDEGTGDLGGIVESIIKDRLTVDIQEVEGLEEARKEAVGMVDWGIVDALFGK